MANPSSPPPRPLSAVILGTDALLAALPATPVQLAHACQRAGFDIALPVSWGDELIAMHCVDEVNRRGPGPAILCSCTNVRTRVLAAGNDLAPFCISSVAPPVAAARYLRAIYGSDDIRVSYIGNCGGAADASIDVRITPREMFARFADLRIDLASEPTVYDSVIPPDRRRYFSQIGGLPSPQSVWSPGNHRTIVEIESDDYAIDLAQYIVSNANVVVDLAARLGCGCAGAVPEMSMRSARAALASLEPPRAPAPVLDPGKAVDIDFPLPLRAERDLPIPISVVGAADRPASRDFLPVQSAFNTPVSLPPDLAVRRTPGSSGVPRVPASSVPTSRASGRSLPRAYVARRRSPASVRGVDEMSPPRGHLALGRPPLAEAAQALAPLALTTVTIDSPAVAPPMQVAAPPSPRVAPPAPPNADAVAFTTFATPTTPAPPPRLSGAAPSADGSYRASTPADAPARRPSGTQAPARRPSRPILVARPPWWRSRYVLAAVAAALAGAAAWLAYTLL